MTHFPFPLPPAVRAGMTIAAVATLAGVLLADSGLPSLIARVALVATFLAWGLGRALGFLVRMMTLAATASARGLGLGMGLALGTSIAYALWQMAGSH